MCDDIQKKSTFYNDDEKAKEARDVLRNTKEMRERRIGEMLTVKLPNGTIISSTNPERIKQYEEYCKRKTGYYRKP